MNKAFSKLIPVGISVKKEAVGILTAMIFSFLHSLSYFASYYNSYHNLYEYYDDKRILISGRKMTDFYILIEGSFKGFYVTAFLLVVLIIYHYAYHYKDSKSIYTMKRLPKKYELHKRCLTVPVICILLCKLFSVILIFIYFRHYICATPPECLVDGQWSMFISKFFL